MPFPFESGTRPFEQTERTPEDARNNIDNVLTARRRKKNWRRWYQNSPREVIDAALQRARIITQDVERPVLDVSVKSEDELRTLRLIEHQRKALDTTRLRQASLFEPK